MLKHNRALIALIGIAMTFYVVGTLPEIERGIILFALVCIVLGVLK